ncbi:putative Rep protein [Circovirus-like genome DCCV-11]|uniref:putative Rep protein n=1 Tax=Circovirus-like genome DCCV-11 TaxID=1788439 RepID=UPI0007F9EBEB|nr:putative Rep protein [Circovirus-like genome DCCV-11]AMB42988.1 putative Rep protein [Circovirus-like genome DCCV-11]
MSSRRWVYTLFAAAEDDYSNLDDFERRLRDHQAFRGLCHQLECCPTTSKVHLQGYVEFEKPQRMAALKKLNSTVHLETAKGTREHCVRYCTKDETRVPESSPTVDPVLLGTTTQGRRNDLLETTLAIVNGELSRDDVFDTRPDLICKYARGINELLTYRAKKERQGDRELHTEVLWGDAGVGKTRYAYGRSTPEDVYILCKGNGGALWWDGYDGQSILVIDDFYGWVEHSVLLRILDRYPFKIDIKGSSTYANWKEVYITSNRHPSTWYTRAFPWTEDKALQRRLGAIYECKATMFGSTWKCEKSLKVRTVDRDFNIEELDNLL